MTVVLITGGAGFIGANLADRLLECGDDVLILDNMARKGVETNLRWLRERHGERVRHAAFDVRDAGRVAEAMSGCELVYHFAAQVAVTTSLEEPLEDHAVNVIGTLNVLEAIRRSDRRPGLLFASTNKVYGALQDLEFRTEGKRYVPADDDVRVHGVDESRALQFISPYGCSKGAADQYVLDYCHSFGLTAAVFRMSCIYGPHQQANSDQGWVTHFLRSVLRGEPLTIFGDGMQVRDVLYIDDFVDALVTAGQNIQSLSGTAFNMGGGPANSLSLLELIDIAERLCRRTVGLELDEPRPGDQLYFAADHRRFTAATGWSPRTPPQQGVERLWGWLLDDRTAKDDAERYQGVSWA